MPVLGWLKKPAAAAAGVDTSGWDEFPVHLMDGNKLNHKVLGWTMRFNDVLDADVLHSALCRLVGSGNWRKMGGRLRRDAQDKGRLKIYVPKEFSAAHPAVEYQHDVFPQVISSHGVGAQFIRPTKEPTVQPLDKQLSGLMAPDGYPDTVDGLVQSSKSQLALRISSFDDATLVSLAFPQTLLDASGLVSLVQNWSLVLAGREGDVAPLLGTQHDLLDDVTRDNDHVAPQDCRMEKMRLTGFGYLKLLGRHMAEAAQRKRRLQALYIPAGPYQALLARLRGDEDGTPVTDADLLTAWLVGIIAAQESGSRPLTLMTLYDLRSCVQKLRGAGHVSQILTSTHCAMFPVETLRNSGAGLARSYREQFATLTTEDEAIAHLKMMRSDVRSDKGFALYGTTDSLVVFCTPLVGLDLARMADFAPAARRPVGAAEAETTATATPAGAVVASVFNALNWSDAGVDALSLLGEDHAGGCWVVAKLSSGSWDCVLAELRS